jgi:hypothetical protein
MEMSVIILDTEFSPVSGDFRISDDRGFAAVEKKAVAYSERCCIHWTRDSDGQAGYWGPTGARLSPHWYQR